MTIKHFTESSLWALVRDHLPGQSERVENALTVGTPDVYNITEGVSTWIELKTLNKLEELSDPVTGLTMEQRRWHKKHWENEGRVFILTRIGNDIYIHRYVDREFYRLLKTSKPFNWGNILEILFLTAVFTKSNPGL